MAAGVTLINVNANENNSDGILITTRGTVSLTKINADRNGNFGLSLSQFGTAYPTVTLTTGHFWFNDNYGLVIYGRGAVTLKDISADDNEGNGAYIQNVSGNVSLLASSTGGNTFNYNYGVHDGLDINTRGTVTLNKVTATGNDGSGVYLWSTATGYTGNVVINGGTFEGGGAQDYGLVALSNGTITLNNVTANDNDFDGIHLNNIYDTTGAKGITVTRIWVHGNGNNGLLADSYGSITVNGIDAQDNADRGVDLDNTYGAFSTPKNISVLGISGFNNISGNGAQGLYILSEGTVSVSKINLTSNVGYAVYINNYQSGLGKGTVTLSYLNVNNNNSRGITIESNNAVSLKYLTVLSNGSGSHGIVVNTHNHNLSVIGSTISNNGAYGLYGSIGTGVFSLSSTYYFGNRGAYNIYILH